MMLSASCTECPLCCWPCSKPSFIAYNNLRLFLPCNDGRVCSTLLSFLSILPRSTSLVHQSPSSWVSNGRWEVWTPSLAMVKPRVKTLKGNLQGLGNQSSLKADRCLLVLLPLGTWNAPYRVQSPWPGTAHFLLPLTQPGVQDTYSTRCPGQLHLKCISLFPLLQKSQNAIPRNSMPE